jgi:hypothetical protein
MSIVTHALQFWHPQLAVRTYFYKISKFIGHVQHQLWVSSVNGCLLPVTFLFVCVFWPPCGSVFFFSFNFSRTFYALFPWHLLPLVQFVKAVTSCQLTVREAARSSAATAACDRGCSSSNFCSIHARQVAFNLSVSKPAQVDDCTTNGSAYLHSIAGRSTVEASIPVL